MKSIFSFFTNIFLVLLLLSAPFGLIALAILSFFVLKALAIGIAGILLVGFAFFIAWEVITEIREEV